MDAVIVLLFWLFWRKSQRTTLSTSASVKAPEAGIWKVCPHSWSLFNSSAVSPDPVVKCPVSVVAWADALISRAVPIINNNRISNSFVHWGTGRGAGFSAAHLGGSLG